MSRNLPAVALIALLGGVAMTLWAQSEPGQSTPGKAAVEAVESVEATAGDAKPDDLVAKLLAMTPEERRAYLKKLAPEERRGLWFRVKKARWDQRGAQPQRPYRELEGHPVDPGLVGNKAFPNKVVGTIAYDSGFPSRAFGGGQFVGNRFDTYTGNPVASGKVSTVQAVVVPGPAPTVNTTVNVGFVLYGPQTGGGGATAIFSTFQTALGLIDTVSFSGLGVNYTGSSFFVLFGDFASDYIPAFGTATALGQGHHALVGYTGGMPPDIVGTFNLLGIYNGFVRATGNIVPVELMTFDVE